MADRIDEIYFRNLLMEPLPVMVNNNIIPGPPSLVRQSRYMESMIPYTTHLRQRRNAIQLDSIELINGIENIYVSLPLLDEEEHEEEKSMYRDENINENINENDIIINMDISIDIKNDEYESSYSNDNHKIQFDEIV